MDVLARSVKLCLHMNFCAQPPEALNEGYLLPMITLAFAFNMMTEQGAEGLSGAGPTQPALHPSIGGS